MVCTPARPAGAKDPAIDRVGEDADDGADGPLRLSRVLLPAVVVTAGTGDLAQVKLFGQPAKTHVAGVERLEQPKRGLPLELAGRVVVILGDRGEHFTPAVLADPDLLAALDPLDLASPLVE
jgi:hypothetical protein